jgi:hypothetical protein
MRIGDDSGAKENAIPLNPVGNDILGNPRNVMPDIGAYNFSIFED